MHRSTHPQLGAVARGAVAHGAGRQLLVAARAEAVVVPDAVDARGFARLRVNAGVVFAQGGAALAARVLQLGLLAVHAHAALLPLGLAIIFILVFIILPLQNNRARQ